MRRLRRLLLAAVLVLAGSPAPAQPAATPSADAKPALPVVTVGALLPLSGPGAWFGREMRQGIQLAVADLTRAPRNIPRADSLEAFPGEAQKATVAALRANDASLPPIGVQIVLEAVDVQALDIGRARAEVTRLLATQAPVVFTASATPALAIQPLAAGRDALVVHQGVITGRFPAESRTFLHTRPSVATQIDALLGHLAERGVRRLAVIAGGDDFGKAVRAAVGPRWRERGGSVVAEESWAIEAPDLAARMRQITRQAPEAVVLGFRGPDLGDLVARLRDGRFATALYLLDDDPTVGLAAGFALQHTMVVSDAFAPELSVRGGIFAETYARNYGAMPSRYAASAYDMMVFLGQGIRVALTRGRGTPGGTRLRETLLTLRDVPSVYGGTLVLWKDGTLARPLALFTVQPGGALELVHTLVPSEPRS
jgi:branched-chain amino acid transport system substrate-binding protein